MRSGRVLLVVAALVAAAVAVVVGVLLTRDDPNKGLDQEAEITEVRTPTGADGVACAKFLADVTVLGSVENNADEVLLTVKVSTYLMPPDGPQKVQVMVADPELADHGLEPWAEGTEGLLLVPTAPRVPAAFFTGADHATQLASYQDLVDRADGRPCPAEFSQGLS